MGMMQLDHSARFTLEEIITHPWLQGPVPTHDQIRNDFSKRSEINRITKIKNGFY
jgi:hypothetical protein